jgi:hypothetical protein
VHRADNLTTYMCQLSRNSGVSTSRNPKGPSRPVAGKLYLYVLSLLTYIIFFMLCSLLISFILSSSIPCIYRQLLYKRHGCSLWLQFKQQGVRINVIRISSLQEKTLLLFPSPCVHSDRFKKAVREHLLAGLLNGVQATSPACFSSRSYGVAIFRLSQNTCR